MWWALSGSSATDEPVAAQKVLEYEPNLFYKEIQKKSEIVGFRCQKSVARWAERLGSVVGTGNLEPK
jgi:hypothetical protein